MHSFITVLSTIQGRPRNQHGTRRRTKNPGENTARLLGRQGASTTQPSQLVKLSTNRSQLTNWSRFQKIAAAAITTTPTAI